MILHIAAHELRRLFFSPLAWVILAVVQVILGWFFLVNVDNFLRFQPRLAGMEGAPGVTDVVVSPLLGDAAIVLLFAVPLITMRLISDERRGQTLTLLFSAPVSMTEIVLGKYLGVIGFWLVMVALVAIMPLSLLVGGTLDFGMFAAALVGLLLLVASFSAVGLFMSTLTVQPTIAAMGTFGVLLLLWVLDWAGQSRTGAATGVLKELSLLGHYEPFLKGVFNTSDLAYFLLAIIGFLILSVRRLDADRLQH